MMTLILSAAVVAAPAPDDKKDQEEFEKKVNTAREAISPWRTGVPSL